MNYREFWQDIGVANFFFCVGSVVCGMLALSALLPFFAKPLSGERIAKHLAPLGLVFIWSVPNLFLSFTQRSLPHLEDLGFRHSTGILFPTYHPQWSVHHFEVRKGPYLPWETLPNSDFFVPEPPLGGSRLEMFVIYSDPPRTGGRGSAVIESLMDQIAARIKSDNVRYKEVCALRLVTRTYSPITDPAQTHAFNADNLEESWKFSGVLAERQLEDRCSEG